MTRTELERRLDALEHELAQIRPRGGVGQQPLRVVRLVRTKT